MQITHGQLTGKLFKLAVVPHFGYDVAILPPLPRLRVQKDPDPSRDSYVFL